MSAEQTFSTSDLRSHAQDYRRDAAQKHKWAYGTREPVNSASGKFRPEYPSTTDFNMRRRCENNAVADSARVNRKYKWLDGDAASDTSSGHASDEFDEALPSPPAPDAGVMYSFDAACGPSEGSQILTRALSQAVERFEERETAKLVSNEYDVLNSDGDSVAISLDKKRKGKGQHASSSSAAAAAVAVADPDEEYEFV